MSDRAEFEGVIQGLGYVPAWDGDCYLYEEVEVAWQAWQAARVHPAQQGSVPEGYVAIPKDVAAAKGMYLVGYSWLNHNAPQELATPQPEGDEWIKCSDRLPTEADADFRGDVWVNDKAMSRAKYQQCLARWNTVGQISDYTHWKPTGLKRPQPPQEDSEHE